MTSAPKRQKPGPGIFSVEGWAKYSNEANEAILLKDEEKATLEDLPLPTDEEIENALDSCMHPDVLERMDTEVMNVLDNEFLQDVMMAKYTVESWYKYGYVEEETYETFLQRIADAVAVFGQIPKNEILPRDEVKDLINAWIEYVQANPGIDSVVVLQKDEDSDSDSDADMGSSETMASLQSAMTGVAGALQGPDDVGRARTLSGTLWEALAGEYNAVVRRVNEAIRNPGQFLRANMLPVSGLISMLLSYSRVLGRYDDLLWVGVHSYTFLLTIKKNIGALWNIRPGNVLELFVPMMLSTALLFSDYYKLQDRFIELNDTTTLRLMETEYADIRAETQARGAAINPRELSITMFQNATRDDMHIVNPNNDPRLLSSAGLWLRRNEREVRDAQTALESTTLQNALSSFGSGGLQWIKSMRVDMTQIMRTALNGGNLTMAARLAGYTSIAVPIGVFAVTTFLYMWKQTIAECRKLLTDGNIVIRNLYDQVERKLSTIHDYVVIKCIAEDPFDRDYRVGAEGRDYLTRLAVTLVRNVPAGVPTVAVTMDIPGQFPLPFDERGNTGELEPRNLTPAQETAIRADLNRTLKMFNEEKTLIEQWLDLLEKNAPVYGWRQRFLRALQSHTVLWDTPEDGYTYPWRDAWKFTAKLKEWNSRIKTYYTERYYAKGTEWRQDVIRLIDDTSAGALFTAARHTPNWRQAKKNEARWKWDNNNVMLPKYRAPNPPLNPANPLMPLPQGPNPLAFDVLAQRRQEEQRRQEAEEGWQEHQNQMFGCRAPSLETVSVVDAVFAKLGLA